MAYVRKRGKQLLIVEGFRDGETGKVDQRILFTIYSKAEASKILGRGNGNNSSQFQILLEHQYPDVRLNWKKIQEGISANIDVLPDLYEYKETRLRSQFRTDLCAFAKQLMLSDPQDYMAASNLIEEHHMELEYLGELIQWRLQLRKQEPNQWNTDNPFYWRFALQGKHVPPDIEEQLEGYFNRGEYERAEVLFTFLTDCFDGYAEGYNYLGLISLEQNRLDAAITRFRTAMDLGRKLFPKRIAKSSYWNVLSTRPYMRAMRNLTLTLNRAGQYEEALGLCERLERECGDDISPAAYRASIFLNTGRWQEAMDSAVTLQNIDPSESLVAAFASYELGRERDASTYFLHAALNYQRAAKMAAGIHTPAPKNYDEGRDHNTGVALHRNIEAYLLGQGRKARRFFKRFIEQSHVKSIIAEKEAVVKTDVSAL